ncbi:hypothetical protein RO21_03795 [[Actinobacillus] muris]|uniref:Uncharacterized protein n=1 Tax=Muribacter muris TaxID=67855 RepID=A0A0J5P6G8_9PAST|nr:hypothetical protein RO21_03795 [[Actinobacillus] muris] [Muribacter muris]
MLNIGGLFKGNNDIYLPIVDGFVFPSNNQAKSGWHLICEEGKSFITVRAFITLKVILSAILVDWGILTM